jgi:hypothetical protein
MTKRNRIILKCVRKMSRDFKIGRITTNNFSTTMIKIYSNDNLHMMLQQENKRGLRLSVFRIGSTIRIDYTNELRHREP